MAESARRRALAARDRWWAAAGPWRRWALAVPLVAPGLDELPPQALGGRRTPDAAADRLAGALAEEARAQPTLLVLDLAPVRGVRVAARLAASGVAHPLLLLGRWPYARAVLPARQLTAALLGEARRLPRAVSASSVSAVLDGDRRRPLPGRRPTDPRADNRYELAADELPDAATLLAAGIRRVLDVRPAGAAPAPPLATAVYPRYAAAGLAVERWQLGGPA